LFQVKAFIPYAWTEADDTPPLVPNPMSGLVAKGDLYPGAGSRPAAPGFRNSYSTRAETGPVYALFDNAPFRVCHTVIVTPYEELHSNADIESKRKLMTAPVSEHYYKTSVDPTESALQMGFKSLNPAGFKKSGDPPTNTPAYVTFPRTPKVAKLSIDGGGRDGAMDPVSTFFAADIHWHLFFVVYADSNPLEPTVQITGGHDRYPAYEIIVNQFNNTFTDVHRFSPSAGERPGPVSLLDLNGASVIKVKTITE
jgi:hypothetical protein